MCMKSYNEMAEAVFARRDEYVREVKRKKKIALSSALSFCAVCLAVVGAIGIWKTGTVEPDPDVLGTKPAYMTESTDVSEELHSLSSNATSEGSSTEISQLVSRPTVTGTNETTNNINNTKPTQAATKPEESKPTQATDPAEKPENPTQRPTNPAENPNNKPAVKPTTPTQKPEINKPTRPVAPVVTEPVETPEAVPPQTDGVIRDPEDSDKPSTSPQPTTAVCATDATSAIDGECPPCSPMEPEVPAATEPTEAPGIAWPDEAPDVPETESPTAGTSVSGAVYDQHGNPVGGCEIYAYSRGMVVAVAKTDSRGFYYIHTSESIEYLSQHSAPEGYTPSDVRMPLSGGADFSNPDVNFYCTKN